MKKIFYFVVFWLASTSCIKNADVEIPQSEAELVIASFVGAGEDTVQLKLTWSAPVYNSSVDNMESEPNALVKIYNGSDEFLMTYDTQKQAYIAVGTNFEAGDKADVSVTYQDLQLTASCIVPQIPQFTFEYLGRKEQNLYGYTEYFDRFKLTNLTAADNNYYRIALLFYYHVAYDPNDRFVNYGYSNSGSFFNLKQNESVEVEYYIYADDYYVLDSISQHIIYSDYNYFQYHKGLENYYGDDFFVEPTIIYDNVSGGIGIFGSYQLFKDFTSIPATKP